MDRQTKNFWKCNKCNSINAYNWTDAERASSLLKAEVFVSTGSCFDNVCGCCHTDWVEIDSPINADCYTHNND
jgi:hypothetical protein